MERSEFIKVLGLGAAGLLLPDTAMLSSKKVKIYENYIKGIAHYRFKKVGTKLKEGDSVYLKREPGNLYDSFAIEVYHGDNKLGYIAAYENIALSNLLDQGVEMPAVISKINRTGTLYNEVAIEVFAQVIIHNPGIIPSANLAKPADEADDIYRKTY